MVRPRLCSRNHTSYNGRVAVAEACSSLFVYAAERPAANDLSIGEDAGCPVHTRALLMLWPVQGLYAEVTLILTLLYNTAVLHGHFTGWLKHQQNITSCSLNNEPEKKKYNREQGCENWAFYDKG